MPLVPNARERSIGGFYETKDSPYYITRNDTALHNLWRVMSFGANRILVYVLFILVLSSGTALSQGNTRPLHVQELAPGLFVHQGVHALMNAENAGAIANVGFIVGNEAVAVIDTGGSYSQGEALLAAVAEKTDKPIRYVILTHVHPDHIFGSAAFLRRNVAFVGHVRLKEAMEARFAHYLAANRPEMGSHLDGVELVLPDMTVTDSLTLDLGGRSILLNAWPPAHTDNDLTVFDPASGTLFSGDLVFLEHLPSIDGSLRGWQRALDGLAAIPATRVVPGHGPIDSPWPAALEPERRYFDALARDLKAAIDKGIPISEAVTSAGLSEAGHWQLFDTFNRRNATAGYAELEWE